MKLNKLAAMVAMLSSTTALAGISVVDTETGNFSIGGDVEFDVDYRDSGEAGGKDHEFSQGGRILIEFYGERFTQSDHQFRLKAQPLMGSNGEVNLDDAWFSFGAIDGWDFRIGRFEAYDMFPVGQDTFLEYSGDTSNDLVRDDAPYVYQMKEARGRGTGGQLMYSQTFGSMYLEVAALLGDRTNLFSTTAGAVTSDGDAFVIRPVVAFDLGDFSLAGAIEANLVSDAIIIGGKDVSDRIGYGFTTNYTNDMFNVNFNAAFMDAVDEQNMSLGINVLVAGFGLGYVYADNDYDDGHYFGFDGSSSVNTTYASYEFADVLDVDDFSIYLGAYYTTVDDKTSTNAFLGTDDDLGLRVRFKFFF